MMSSKSASHTDLKKKKCIVCIQIHESYEKGQTVGYVHWNNETEAIYLSRHLCPPPNFPRPH